jgi:DNA-binding beta-propeller fold protein YncE
MDRRDFLKGGLAVAGLVAGRPPWPARTGRTPLALTTADKQAHVVVASLASGRVLRRIATREDPRSIECHGAGPAVVAHSGIGVVSLIDTRDLAVRRVLGGFDQPRYTAIARGGDLAYVSDGGSGELATIDLRGGRVVHRTEVGPGARHLTRSPDGRALWVSLGSSAAEIAVLDLADPLRPVVRRRVRPPFLAHDVSFSPSGRRVWVTAGREPRLAIYPAAGHGGPLLLAADPAPQHVSFGAGGAYVASGNGRSLQVRALSDGAVRRSARVPLGSYNVQGGAGRVLTPSLSAGTLTILDARGRVLHSVRVADAAHDACVVS